MISARLDAQLLTAPARSVTAVVERLFALQAQDFHAARWALGMRVAHSTVETVDAAFNRGELVRSWPMRGTLHAVATRDAGWLAAFFGARNRRRVAARHRALGTDERAVRRARALAERFLARGPATREVLFDALERGGLPTADQVGVHLVWSLAQLGVLAFGPVVDDAHAFVLLDGWVKKPRQLAGDEALGELAARYFAGHGPATVRDLSFWTGLTLRESKRATEIAAVDAATPRARALRRATRCCSPPSTSTSSAIEIARPSSSRSGSTAWRPAETGCSSRSSCSPAASSAPGDGASSRSARGSSSSRSAR